MQFTSAREAVCYYLCHQLMTPANDMEKLWVKVQHTVRGGAGKVWLGVELGDLCRGLNERNLAWLFLNRGNDLQNRDIRIAYLLEEMLKNPESERAADEYELELERLRDRKEYAICIGKLAYRWALYAYGGEDSTLKWDGLKHSLALAEYMIIKYKEAGNKVTLKGYKKISKLATLALQDFKIRDCTGQPKWKDADLAKQMGVDQANWKRTWEPKMKIMQAALNELASLSLAPVRLRLDELAEMEGPLYVG